MPLTVIDKPLVMLVGPTAVGKTELSLGLAEALEGEIISSDSRLFYRGMDIGTAKPTAEDRRRVPHHLIDVANPDENWSLALFQCAAYHAVDDIHARGKLPLMVGGTGQYVHAILHGWEIPPQEPDDSLRQQLNQWAEKVGADEFHQRLAFLDPAAAETIDARNVRRSVRAMEVILRTGERFSTQRRQGARRYAILQIGMYRPREEIFQRVDQRIESMFTQGLCQEVQALLDAGYTPDLPSMASIGYRETAAFLRGEITLEAAKARMRKLTHAFVRRQSNWFKHNDPHIQWFDAREPDCFENILNTIRKNGLWLLPQDTQPAVEENEE
jgi:tRNA dimethylallyltransferase